MKKLYCKKLISSLIFSGAGIFTLLFFSPLEVYLGNPTDFRVSIYSAITILGLASAGITLVYSLLVSLLPVKVLKVLNLYTLGITLCFYIQSLFLNGELIKLDGEKLELSIATKIINAVIWVAIFALVIALWRIFKKLRKEKLFINVTKWVAVALVIMQVTGFISLFLGYDTSENDSKDLYFSTEGRLEVSDKNNVIYFIIDYCDGQIVKDTLKEDPNLFDGLDGFTYYPDNLYIHGRSYPAITYLLTGEKCYYDKTVNEYINDSFKNNSYIKALDKSGTDIRYYTDPRYVGAEAKPYVKNYKSANSNDLSDIRVFEYIKQTLKVTGFRGLPYIVKEKFSYDTEVVNEKSLIRKDDFAPIIRDLLFYDAIKDTGVSVNEKYSSAYRFYHMYGSHPGATVNENAEYEKGVTLPQALRGDMKIIKTYLQQLKDLGVYDNSTIIITADHGRYTGEMTAPQTCLMLVKEAGADSTKPIKTSNASVSHENLFATVLNALGEKSDKFETPISKVKAGSANTRYTYHTEKGKDGLESALQEYEVKGNADDLKNYSKTKNKWEVEYSIYH